VSGRRRLGFIAAVAGVALVGALVARRARVAPSPPPFPSPLRRSMIVPAAAPATSAVARTIGSATPPLLPRPEQASTQAGTSATQPGSAPAVLTPVGASRALEAIGKNEQTRRLFMRLQPVGLSPEQQARVLLILGTAALRPTEESPTLEALRAGGGSRVLSDDEANRVRDERRQIDERVVRSLRPALAAVLTPSQLARAGLNRGDTSPASHRDRQ
jgi:hypothetical protein